MCRFSLFVSALVLQKAGSGDPEAATRRLAELLGIPVVGLSGEARQLARRFPDAGLIPERGRGRLPHSNSDAEWDGFTS